MLYRQAVSGLVQQLFGHKKRKQGVLRCIEGPTFTRTAMAVLSLEILVRLLQGDFGI